MRKAVAAVALLAVALLPATRAAALQSEDLLALVAMPLAVAAVAQANNVPTSDVIDVVRILNRAEVPPPQFIQIVRYAPAAVVVEQRPDPFVAYLNDQYDSGLRGTQFVTVVQDRLRTYDLGPVDLNVVEPVPVTYRLDTSRDYEYERTGSYEAPVVNYYEPAYYEPRTFFPPVVQTRVIRYYSTPLRTVYDTNDLLALAAMPLAVVAASELTGVPSGELFQMVTLLNAASVPPAQFIQVVRYAPPALVYDYGGVPFVTYLQDRYDYGLRGTPYVTVIQDRLRTYDLGSFDLVVTPQQILTYQPEAFYGPDTFFPPEVRMRVNDYGSHPHGGPPGQRKKQMGLQTGAEVVHGTTRSARFESDRRSISRNRYDDGATRAQPRAGKQAVRAERPQKSKVRSESPGGRSGSPQIKKERSNRSMRNEPGRGQPDVVRVPTATRPEGTVKPGRGKQDGTGKQSALAKPGNGHVDGGQNQQSGPAKGGGKGKGKGK